MATAWLMGEGWGRWRGCWASARVLRCDGGRWRLLDDGREAAAWADLRTAAEELWRVRGTRTGCPWAVGWLGYEVAAGLAGAMPHVAAAADGTESFWLLEPNEVPRPTTPQEGHPTDEARLETSLDDAAYAAAVARVREHIAAGAVYQVNLTRRFELNGWDGGLADFVASARARVTPPYLAWLADAESELVCASMELLLRRRGEVVQTRPIKGTRPRGATAVEDQALALDLAADPKELAELAMVVDLERNDLGRVARTGSVRVADPGSVHAWGSVHHRVATVSARVDRTVPWWELVAVMAPGGSVTGCPKWAAMDLIRQLEPAPRGPYCGAFGVVAGNGDLEIALPIRTAWRTGARVRFGAGCGIVWDSVEQREVAESRLKVAAWLELVGARP